MACFWLHQNETSINISGVEEVGAVTYYKIEINVGDVKWGVSHRYNDFYDLHNILVVDHGVSKDILPPKKAIRNKTPEFIETRRRGLEAYLRSVLNYLKRTMPKIFVEFLNFHAFDIYFMLQNLALHLYFEADNVLCTTKSYKFNPLQLHAISECFKRPFPEIEHNDIRCDLSNVMDFCSQLEHLCIVGSLAKFQSSNLIPNRLPFELSAFKSLQFLEVGGINFEQLYSTGTLRSLLQNIRVHKTAVTSISQILLCDVIHKSVVNQSEIWTAITKIDFSNNNLTNIDESIQLVPNVKVLLLDHNKISSISNLSFLTQLVHLSLSDNLISSCDQLHTKLGNIRTLDLSQNAIVSLRGFSKLYSLESLDISFSKVSEIEDVTCIGDLPCLENLILMGNSVATTVDYRIKVLEPFGERSKDICLDNEKPSQSEIDKVLILRALRIVKEGKMPSFKHSFSSL